LAVVFPAVVFLALFAAARVGVGPAFWAGTLAAAARLAGAFVAEAVRALACLAFALVAPVALVFVDLRAGAALLAVFAAATTRLAAGRAPRGLAAATTFFAADRPLAVEPDAFAAAGRAPRGLAAATVRASRRLGAVGEDFVDVDAAVPSAGPVTRDRPDDPEVPRTGRPAARSTRVEEAFPLAGRAVAPPGFVAARGAASARSAMASPICKTGAQRARCALRRLARIRNVKTDDNMAHRSPLVGALTSL